MQAFVRRTLAVSFVLDSICTSVSGEASSYSPKLLAPLVGPEHRGGIRPVLTSNVELYLKLCSVCQLVKD